MSPRNSPAPQAVATLPCPAYAPGDPVGRLATRAPVYVPQDSVIGTVAEVMAEESIGVVLVGGPHGPLGIVSERDIALAVAEGERWAQARDLMTPDLAWIDGEAPILAAARLMLDNEIRHLVVRSGSATVGVVSMRDVLGVLVAHVDGGPALPGLMGSRGHRA